MKTAVSSYSFGPYQKSLGNEGIMKKAKEMGFDGIEFIDSHIASLDEATKSVIAITPTQLPARI